MPPSSLRAVQDAILLVNSDLYISGARSHRELDLPAVLRNLDGTRFTLRGYPESNSEKLLLITISRYIERLVSEAATTTPPAESTTDAATGGTLRTSFQRLSRIEDERGTRAVYEQLAETPADVHVYGQPDWIPSRALDVTMHGGYDEDFRRAWFVVYSPGRGEPAGDAPTPAALLAVEREPRTWDGFWTFDAETVADINEYIAHEM